jgi:NAD(P)-dependent dehydrogenase (short-subunit alcohol dehydrogenase family)
VTDVAYDFSNRVVAVTGAATGIGAAVAGAFAAAGAKVFMLDIDADGGAELASQLERAVFVECDVTDPEQVEAVFERIRTADDHLDVLVNNAGGFWVQRTTEDLPYEEWQRVIDLNLTAVFLTSKAAVSLLRASTAGRIINVGSMAGQTAGYRTSPAYAAAKAAVHSLTRVMDHELASDGITVNALAPSAVMTERIRQVRDEAEREATAETIPLGRYQTPEEAASWVLYLASSQAGYMTGQTVSVNGGRFMT